MPIKHSFWNLNRGACKRAHQGCVFSSKNFCYGNFSFLICKFLVATVGGYPRILKLLEALQELKEECGPWSSHWTYTSVSSPKVKRRDIFIVYWQGSGLDCSLNAFSVNAPWGKTSRFKREVCNIHYRAVIQNTFSWMSKASTFLFCLSSFKDSVNMYHIYVYHHILDKISPIM